MLFLNFNFVFSQVSYEFALPDTFNAIDIYSDGNQFLNIVEKNALYQLNGGQLEIIKTFPKALDRLGFKSFNDSVRIYNNQTNGFTELDIQGNLISHDAPINHSYLSKLSTDNYLLLGKHLYEYNENSWSTLSYKNQQSSNFITEDSNDRVIFNDNKQILSYNPLIGVDTILIHAFKYPPNQCLEFQGNLYYTSRNKIYKTLSNGKSISIIDSLDLDSQDIIVDIMPYNQQLIAISQNAIFLIDVNTMSHSSIPLIGNDMEEWLALEINTEESFWLLSTQSLYLITNIKFHTSIIDNNNPGNIFYYTIRNNEYLTDGNHVYKKEKSTNKYTLDPNKVAPQKIIKRGTDHPFLIFKNYAIQIHEDNALIINYLEFPNGETCNDLYSIEGNMHIATNQNVYKQLNSTFKKISNRQDDYSNFIISDSLILIEGESGFYKIENKQISAFTEISDYQYGMFGYEGKLLYSINDNSLKIIDIDTEEDFDNLFGGIPYIDFTLHKNYLILLCNKSIIISDFDKVLDGNILIEQIIPLPFDSTNSNIIDVYNNTILIQNGETLVELEIPSKAIFRNPMVRIEKDIDDHKLIVKHTNHWSSNPKFNYLFSSNDGNEAIWTNDPNYDINEMADKYETVMVTMKDDVFPEYSYSNILKLNQTLIKFNYPFYIISLLIIFAASFLGLRLIST